MATPTRSFAFPATTLLASGLALAAALPALAAAPTAPPAARKVPVAAKPAAALKPPVVADLLPPVDARLKAAATAAGLPVAVQRTREAIYALAASGRYETLEALARRNKGFTYHFGFEKRDPAAFWRAEAKQGHDPLPKLAALLRMPHVQDEGVFTWPAAAGVNPTPADWEALKPTFPAARVARWKAEGYTGWRLGIDARGNWTYFVRGD